MVWKEIEIKIRNSMYPNYLYWKADLFFPSFIKNSIYKKYYFDPYVKFERIPENWLSVSYYLVFDKLKGYYYPTSDDIKFFNFNLFKKNGFLFLLFCGLLFKNCFIEFLFLLGKSLFAFYTIADLIYVILLIRKHCYFFIRLCYYLSFNLAVLFMLIKFNNTLNFYLKSKDKWYF